MLPSIKIVTEEILMCGLRKIPIVNTVIEVINAVQARCDILRNADRLATIEQGMSSIERKMRELVRSEIEGTLANLSRPNLDGPTLTREVNQLRAIQREGWEPTLFEGLLRNSSHWQELRRSPNNYGKVLSDGEPISPEGIHVLFDTDRTRVLELTPYAFSNLLARQEVGVPDARVVTTRDIWAFPTCKPNPPIEFSTDRPYFRRNRPPAIPNDLPPRKEYPDYFKRNEKQRVYLVGSDPRLTTRVRFIAKLAVYAGQSTNLYDLVTRKRVWKKGRDDFASEWNSFFEAVGHEIPYAAIPEDDAVRWTKYGLEEIVVVEAELEEGS